MLFDGGVNFRANSISAEVAQFERAMFLAVVQECGIILAINPLQLLQSMPPFSFPDFATCPYFCRNSNQLAPQLIAFKDI